MFSGKSLRPRRTLYLGAALIGAIFGLLWHRHEFSISSTSTGPFLGRIFQLSKTGIPNEQPYRAQIFSRDPMVIYIRSFLHKDEIDHLLRLAEGNYQQSKVYRGFDEKPINLEIRDSQSAHIDRSDPVVRRIEKRAMEFQGWRGPDTVIEPPTIQRYAVDGFYSYHFDWDPSLTGEGGNRITTFNVYLVGDCTGGGTNFPYLERPNDARWCDVIECTEEGMDGYQGVTFKAIPGSAVFWENMHPNGSTHEGVYHAGLPVKSGVKVGLNIWSWDKSWKSPDVEAVMG
ncbi:putative prolyl 4-hydroxylase [Podospora aff. communis PSN243]|uniref:Prolyl 4-hydroxylase n=1 Tax=Podospora aff. communis PSN243 TaxID=3040156 RepID=A0AAV9G6G2_9PEZI|nr:putative prolyl 4-hydroxylase [Podospora aff. communis PSN243]